ncbi:hypothetical protein GCM10018966_008280 [Streptomyces yanii]
MVLDVVGFMRRTLGGPDENPLNVHGRSDTARPGVDPHRAAAPSQPCWARHSGASTDQISESCRVPRYG